MDLPKKIYVALQQRAKDEILGYMVIADKEETKTVQKKIDSAVKWAKGYQGKPLPSIYIDNKPKTGFKLVTNVTRYKTSNVLWRIMHPDGFEFEISSDNMCDLLATNSIVNGEFKDELFFTANRQLVNTKTELFAEMIKAQETKENTANNIKLLVPGSIIEFTSKTKNKNEEYMYCGKFHVISKPSNDAYNIPEKSTLSVVLKELSTGRFFATTPISTEFKITGSGTITPEEVIDGIKQTRNDNVYIYYGPTARQVYCIDQKPFKSDRLTVQYEEVDHVSFHRLRPNDVYIVVQDNVEYRVLGHDYGYSKGSAIKGYPCIRNENGVPIINLDMSKYSHYRDDVFENRYYTNSDKPKLKTLTGEMKIYYGKLSY